jgi:hypothetical protein
MDEASGVPFVFPERRRPGRPRLSDEPMTAVTAFIPVEDYQRLVRLSNQRPDKSLSGLIRDVIIRRIR